MASGSPFATLARMNRRLPILSRFSLSAISQPGLIVWISAMR